MILSYIIMKSWQLSWFGAYQTAPSSFDREFEPGHWLQFVNAEGSQYWSEQSKNAHQRLLALHMYDPPCVYIVH